MIEFTNEEQTDLKQSIEQMLYNVVTEGTAQSFQVKGFDLMAYVKSQDNVDRIWLHLHNQTKANSFSCDRDTVKSKLNPATSTLEKNNFIESTTNQVIELINSLS